MSDDQKRRRGTRSATNLVLHPLGEEIEGDLGLVVRDHVSGIVNLLIEGRGRQTVTAKGREKRGGEQGAGGQQGS